MSSWKLVTFSNEMLKKKKKKKASFPDHDPCTLSGWGVTIAHYSYQTLVFRGSSSFTEIAHCSLAPERRDLVPEGIAVIWGLFFEPMGLWGGERVSVLDSIVAGRHMNNRLSTSQSVCQPLTKKQPRYQLSDSLQSAVPLFKHSCAKAQLCNIYLHQIHHWKEKSQSVRKSPKDGFLHSGGEELVVKK